MGSLHGHRSIPATALLAVVLAALGLRLWRIDAPPLDFPADRQITTAILIEAWSGGRPLDGFKQPGWDAADNVRLLMPEAPILPGLAAATARLFDLDRYEAFTAARLWTVVFSVLSLLLIFDLGRRWMGAHAGLFAAGAFGILPASVYWGRAVIPDVPMTTFMLAALCAADRAVERLAGRALAASGTDGGNGADGRNGMKASGGDARLGRGAWGWLGLAALLVGLAVLAKIYGALIAVVIWTLPSRFESRRWGWRFYALWTGGLALAAWAPASIYYDLPFRGIASRLSEMASETNRALTLDGHHTPYGMAWMAVFINRLELALTPAGLLLGLAGQAALIASRRALVLWTWLLYALAFGYLLIQANTYWMYLLLPPACLCMGAAAEAFWRRIAQWSPGRWRRIGVGAVSVAAVVGALGVSPSCDKVLKSYYCVDNATLRAGEFVRRHTTEGSRGAAWGGVPFDLLWASGRTGLSVPRDPRQQIGRAHV